MCASMGSIRLGGKSEICGDSSGGMVTQHHGRLKDTQWHYAQHNAQLCTHQGTKPPPQAFKHCLATMRARGRKQGGLARDNDLAAMYSTPTNVRAERRGCSVCKSSEAEADLTRAARATVRVWRAQSVDDGG